MFPIVFKDLMLQTVLLDFELFCDLAQFLSSGPMRGGWYLAGTSIQGLPSQKWACESLKDPCKH